MATFMDAIDVGYKQGEDFINKPIAAKNIINSEDITVEAHMGNKTIHLSPEQVILIANAIQNTEKGAANGVATLDDQGKIPASQLDMEKYASSINVENYSALLALSTSDAAVNSFVFVSDASGDSTVDSGWAIYRRVGDAGNTAADWTKIAEKESLDISFTDYTPQIQEAKTEALKLDAAYCESEEDMQTKDLRDGAIVFMKTTQS